MVQGLEEILKDQKEDLNPHDGLLHRDLLESIFRTNSLKECAKEILGGDCSPALPPPKMPITYFERKQWSHTFLETAAIYISWLEHQMGPLTKLRRRPTLMPKTKRVEWDLLNKHLHSAAAKVFVCISIQYLSLFTRHNFFLSIKGIYSSFFIVTIDSIHGILQIIFMNTHIWKQFWSWREVPGDLKLSHRLLSKRQCGQNTMTQHIFLLTI